MSRFQTIGILGKTSDPARVGPTLVRLVKHLRARGHAVLCDPDSASLTGLPASACLTVGDLGRHCDLAVVVGGDGTLLGAARALAGSGVPLVGINLGRLGFLVDVSPDQIEGSLDRILDGAYCEEARWMLTARVESDSKDGLDPDPEPEPHLLALNDVVIHKWNTARMIEFETYIDGVFVNAQRSDGIIIATPTGSTAYALSGGGPLLHPALDLMVLVSICPHTMSNRPLVVSGDSRIEIRLCGFDQGNVQVTCDGQTDLSPRPHARILIQKHQTPVRLLHPEGHDHYAILRAKLGWGGHQRPRTDSADAPAGRPAC